MSEKSRICPDCGGVTDAGKCEICGRKTIPLSLSASLNELDPSSYSYKKSVQGDLNVNQDYEKPLHEYQPHSYADEKSDTTSSSEQVKSGHIQEMLKYGRNYQKPPINSGENSRKVAVYIGIAVAVFVLIGILASASFDNSDHFIDDEDNSDYLDIFDQYDYFEQYLTEVKDNTPLICTIDETDNEVMIVNNPTSYLFDADIIGEDKSGAFEESVWRGSAQQNEYIFHMQGVFTCSTENITYYKLDYGASDIPYTMTETNFDEYKIEVDDVLTVQEINELMKHIYAKQVISFSDYYSDYDLYINGTKAYTVTMDFDNKEISFKEYGSFDSIRNIDMDFD